MAELRKRRRLSASGDSKEARNVVTNVQEDKPAGSTGPTAEDTQHRRTLFVRSLPATATTESVAEYFSQSYPIKHATVVLDPTTKQSKGYGFVTFADPEDAQQALNELNGTNFEGRKIKIEVAEPRKRDIDERQGKSVPSAASSKAKEEREQQRKEARPPKLIVRNLPWSISEPEHLAVLFRSYGKVKHAVIPKKNDRHAGFGFVVLRGRKNAENALVGVNGKEVDGRTIAVDWAVEKNVWDELQETAPEDGVEAGDEAKTSTKEEDGGLDEEDEEGGVALGDGDEDGGDDVSILDAAGEDDDAEMAENEKNGEDERNACTVFIRNLPFTATDETLYEHFTQFGPLRYARVVFDHETERPRGTAFVCFWKLENATNCVREAPRHAQQTQGKSATGFKHSVLEDENQDPSGKYTMDGRVLQISFAVSKGEAERLTIEGSARRDQRDKDRRRLYLLSEGTIPTNSPLYAKLSPMEIKMREASAKQRQKLVKANPMLHISLTRLSIRNLPRNIDSKGLKALAREGVVGFATDVKNGLRQPLSKEELARSTDGMKEAEQDRKAKGKGIVRQAKVVFEGRDGSKVSEKEGAGKSRGYGFVEYTSHRSALMGLRWLNGHAVHGYSSSGEDISPAEKKKRLIVEFAIENLQVVKRRIENETKFRQKDDGDGGQESSYKDNKWRYGGEKLGEKRKRNDGNEGVKAPSDKKPRAEAGEDNAEKDNQIAKRNRIISKKRMARRVRKGN